MPTSFTSSHAVLASFLACAVGAAACSGSVAGAGGDGTGTLTTGHGASGTTSGAGGTGGSIFTSGSGGIHTGGGQQQGFDVEPSALQTITVPMGQTAPTVSYMATLDGQPVGAGWGVDRGDVGTVAPGPSPTATFTPTGTTGGLVTISAGLNGATLKRQIMVKLTGSQNGPNPNSPAEQAQIPADTAALTAGGGVGGVGGEGLGGVVDPGVLAVLGSPAGDGSAQGLKLLYPYDKTVWPRGLLAPLLQWDWAVGDADAIQIELSTTSGSFSWKGSFARPAILAQNGKKFTRHPIPQDVWESATNTAGGLADQLTVKLTVAQGGQAYGPISETWTIAPGRLSGTIYYNSYGTQLAHNLGGAVGGNHMFGGAVLSIHVGDTGPKLTAGGDGTTAQCRVCHSVAANGSRLVVSEGTNYSARSAFDLSPTGAVEHPLANLGPWFPGVYPDGSMMLTGDGKLLSLPNDATPLASTGLSTPTPYMPAFSPDGKRVAFNMGQGTQTGTKLGVMDFDPTTFTFSNPTVVVDDSNPATGFTPGWPAFFPDGKSVVFEHETAVSVADGHSSGILWTRAGAKGHIAWTGAGASGITPLDQLNGKGYLPKVSQPVPIACNDAAGHQVGGIDPDHGDDANVNYEPTVNPVASGGYAWVVFTSRRMYGSVANIPPFCSDPRGVDLIVNTTPKKLWVAAIDVSGQPGTDASHPAFYLPAQELLAGNSRGFWALDPCRPDGQGCDSGDQCCNGYCEPDGAGALVCNNTPPGGMCSGLGDKCGTAADCCDGTNLCVNGFCTQKGPA